MTDKKNNNKKYIIIGAIALVLIIGAIVAAVAIFGKKEAEIISINGFEQPIKYKEWFNYSVTFKVNKDTNALYDLTLVKRWNNGEPVRERDMVETQRTLTYTGTNKFFEQGELGKGSLTIELYNGDKLLDKKTVTFDVVE